MTPEQLEIQTNFCAITGSSEEESISKLEAANWDMITATEQFYASDDIVVPVQSAPAAQSDRKMKTMNDLKTEKKGTGQEYYAGGEKSGVAIQGPSKNNAQELVGNIMKQAIEAGPREEEAEGFFGGSGLTCFI